MSAKHTPGPWEADMRRASGLIWGPEVDGVLGIIGYVRLDDTRERRDGIIEEVKSAEAEANARLIAAAPELLEVVELIAALDIEDENVGALGLDDAVVAARAAIAKARGEQP